MFKNKNKFNKKGIFPAGQLLWNKTGFVHQAKMKYIYILKYFGQLASAVFYFSFIFRA